MLIPSIDLSRGRIVQLVQGETLAIETDDIDGWIQRFKGRTKIQLIDLDAAKGDGANNELVARICRELPCRVGGGVRSIERARLVLDMGATHVIAGSALFAGDRVDLEFTRTLSTAIGANRLIAAVDSRGGRVVVHGWRTQLAVTAEEAIRTLEPFVSEFLYTNVDREGLMQGTDTGAIQALRNATSRRIAAAGGITTADEIVYLDSIGVDAIVGMAIYTGRLDPADMQ
jgi:phosphoribosylformimino-5-aminoimidazole carboxamide ribotide isomerase